MSPTIMAIWHHHDLIKLYLEMHTLRTSNVRYAFIKYRSHSQPLKIRMIRIYQINLT